MGHSVYSQIPCQVRHLYLAVVCFFPLSEGHQAERRLLRRDLHASPAYTYHV